MGGSPGQREHHPGLERVVIEPGGVFEDVSEGAQGYRHPLRHSGGRRSEKSFWHSLILIQVTWSVVKRVEEEEECLT